MLVPPWCQCGPGACATSLLLRPQRLHHLGAGPSCPRHLGTWPQPPTGPSVPLPPRCPSCQPVGKARRRCRQCGPTAAPGTCTRCGVPPGASPKPPSACSPPSWCWCWVSGPPCWGEPPPPRRQGHPSPGVGGCLPGAAGVAPCREGIHGSDVPISSPVYLHDLGIVHRDVKVGGSRAGGTEGGVRGSPNAPAWKGHPSACLVSDGEHPPG